MFTTDDTAARIDAIDVDRPGAWGLFLRHAERHPIVTAADVLSAGLTDNGRIAARELGRKLRTLPIGQVISSPISRCIDTATHILEGHGASGKSVDINDMLVNAFIENGRLAEVEYTRRDPELVILGHLNGESVPGLVSVRHGATRLLHFTLRSISNRTLTLFISHDSIIMPLRGHFCQAGYSSRNWQPYLTGALIYAHAGIVEIDGVRATEEPF